MNQRPIAEATKAFEDLRQPRVRRYQTASQEGDKALLNAPPKLIPMRDQAIAQQTKVYEEELLLSIEERRAKSLEAADMNARFPSEPYMQWLHRFDAIADTREYVKTLL